MSKRYVITTCCDAKYGDFLIEHWLRSLQQNVDLTDIDIVVLDYGLTDSQQAALVARDVRCLPCERDGFVCNLRYRDIVRLLDETPYEQVMSVDSGDVIFQSDVSHLFGLERDCFRVVREEAASPFFEMIVEHRDIRDEFVQPMLSYLHNKRMLNCGMVLGSRARFQEFWREYQRLCHDFSCYGVDQFAFNYYAYKNRSFRLLDTRYNFVLIATQSRYRIRKGVFYDRDDRVIPVVHNAGNKPWWRPIDQFGYGPERNRSKVLAPLVIRFAAFWMCMLINLKYLASGATDERIPEISGG